MTQSVYYQRVKVNACCFVTSSLPGIYKSVTDYCKNNTGSKILLLSWKFNFMGFILTKDR
jgi:hypothetical protein